MKDFLTVLEIARLLRINGYTVRRWIKDGVLDAEIIHEGKRMRYFLFVDLTSIY